MYSNEPCWLAGRGMFSGMRNLQQLNLHNNLISTLEPLAFESSPHLTTLDLGENRLSTVPKEAFSGLNKLFWLDLCCNEIQGFPEGTFQHKIANIIIHGKIFSCIQLYGAVAASFLLQLFQAEYYSQRSLLLFTVFKFTAKKLCISFGNSCCENHFHIANPVFISIIRRTFLHIIFK